MWCLLVIVFECTRTSCKEYYIIYWYIGGNEHRHTFYNGFSPAARDPTVDAKSSEYSKVNAISIQL